MSAELLREAAALMRSRANKATGSEWTSGPHFQRANCASVFNGRRTDAHYLAMYATTADAEHIASWHPAVALAVADWLDAVAAKAEANPNAPTRMRSALTVARVYLGHDS